MLSLIPPFILGTLLLLAYLLGNGEGHNTRYELSLARDMMATHNIRSLEARSHSFDQSAADMTIRPEGAQAGIAHFITEIVELPGGTNWIITWPSPGQRLLADQIEGITAQLLITNYKTPGRTSVNDFAGPYDALNGRIFEVELPDTDVAIPDYFPVIASRYDPS